MTTNANETTTLCCLCGKPQPSEDEWNDLSDAYEADRGFDAGEFGGGSLVYEDEHGDARFCACPGAGLSLGRPHRRCDEDYIGGLYVALRNAAGDVVEIIPARQVANAIFDDPRWYFEPRC